MFAALCSQQNNPHRQLCATMCRECAEDCRKALPLVK
ncbi:four-helix bundle copper-binding protein [Qipengyuania gaetbuli]|nr:four-helix bundle copper-binding protein [Qipengyuania gaetbuli]MCA0910839.1 four-helix bundle copper-binding protein [Qipengyuania gaetbuli]